MTTPLETTLRELSDIQREAVEWDGGALLVLAGPGSGKTRVLACRAACLLNRSRDERFRVLGLTFTNKAAHEMSHRVTALAPGIDDRARIRTFHGFCAEVLRQHGTHVDIRSDFAIYARKSDRQAVLEDALVRDSACVDSENFRLLPRIDRLKANLVGLEDAEQWLTERCGESPDDASRLARAYSLYEKALRCANALDFNSLIFDAYRLFDIPVIARHYRRVYRYWLIDEFQDTNHAQYALLRRMAGGDFRKILAVADDDQTLYEWNGADVDRIRTLVEDFDCEVLQLPTNYRCPPPIVEAANRLVVYNTRRADTKILAGSPQCQRSLDNQPIQWRVFETEKEEAAGVAVEIAGLDVTGRGQTLVLARTRALLEPLRDALLAEGVSATIRGRRDDFASPEMRDLVACLKQINHPHDRRNLATLAQVIDRFVPTRPASSAGGPAPPDLDDPKSHPATEGRAHMSLRPGAAQAAALTPSGAAIADLTADITAKEMKIVPTINQILDHFGNEDLREDIKDDLSAWRRLSRDIRRGPGPTSLAQFLQELELRSKEPPAAPGAVSLATIHGAKGLEFDTVYLVGLAEEILPSWHSLRQGNGCTAMEEERRGCFVAITRTRKRLVLSRARHYRGRQRQPSRFLAEMGFTGIGSDPALENGNSA